MRVDANCWHHVCPHSATETPIIMNPSVSSGVSTPCWYDTAPLDWELQKKNQNLRYKKPDVWTAFGLFVFSPNSLTGRSWRMLSYSQRSLRTWKQLRRRWVLMVMSLWTFFSSLITFLLSRWAGDLLHRYIKKHHLVFVSWPQACGENSRGANSHWYHWISQYLFM